MSGHTPWSEIRPKVGDTAQTRPTDKELAALAAKFPTKKERKK